MKGICGLGNVGNTCYINAALQILSQIPELNHYLGSREEFKNITDSILTYEWIQLYNMIQENHCSISPHRFLQQMRQTSIRKNRHEFASHQQNDSVEYFAFMIDCIHNSLNLLDPAISIDKPKETLYSTLFSYLKEIEVKDRSIITHLFLSCSLNQYMDPQTQQICLTKIEHEQIISLSIPDLSNVSLHDCFAETFKDELLTGDNAWFDDKDQIKKTVLKRSALCFLPPILILHLKRWMPNLSKKRKKVHAPTLMDLSPFTQMTDSTMYELFGIINHEGSMQHGHYYAYICKGNEWFSMNDHFVQTISPDQLIHENNYCLFYRKIK